ncbi:hypothetical protein [Acinetobacter soli]|uniref:Uncharacterized protein n=1 Tax=Acinetobacter soli TaxID=487316 RepID=A0AB38YVZ6_9GAMM|nr:hypothetical protein [Acinetobacter soli]WEI00867.1 hypothetical protein PYR77_02045 [Acinetobacter soli]WND05617.1 hypothetical protein RHP80_00115 [Acinetobacter soli]
MNTILNAKEAFEALQNRKTVLCRYAGNGTLPGDKDFSSLDQMPATVFVMPHYEFCIKIETMELAGITFAKPMTLEEYIDGQEVYVLNTYNPSIYVFNFKSAALIESIESGFVQRDAENAKLQLAAISKALGREISEEIKISRLGEEPKKQRTRKKTAEVHAETKAEETVSETKSEITITSQGPVNVVEDTLISEPSSEQATEDFESILADLIERASIAQSPAEANALFKYTKGWTQEQSAPLHAAVSRRLSELPQPEAKEPPSLLVRIQKAADLTELDALEIDVSARDERIQPTLMAEVYKRRKQLEAPINLIDEAFP